MRKIIFFIGFYLMMNASQGQTHIDQNGWQSSVSNLLNGTSTQAMRFEVAAVGYNSHHWQSGGLIFIELFNNHYATGYAKFVLENGYTQGVNTGSPVLRLVETYGVQQNARVTLGDVSDLNTQSGGYSNRRLPIYVDVMKYSRYKVKITFLQTLVDEVTNQNQISFNVTPTGTAIADFPAQTSPNTNISGTGNLMITGAGAHYISNGNVGVGTTTPVATLHVGKKETTAISGEANIDRIAIQPYYHTGGPWFFNVRDNSSKAFLDIKYGSIKLYTIDNTGNIGIGTTSPTEKLSVNGNIRAKQIKVEAANWPDYVFDSSYQLMPLSETETFIKKYQHLPGVPSAKQVASEGIELGSNQAVLLKKIEEMTLHLIQMKKRMDEQEEEIKRLKNKAEEE